MASASSGSSQTSRGRACVAGGPGHVSCTNTQYTPGVSMHLFPNQEKDAKRRHEWVKFVRKHRPGFNASASSELCSIHFEETSFTKNKAIAASLGLKRKLVPEAVPTIDVAISADTAEISKRQRRQVGLVVLSFPHSLHSQFYALL